MFNSSFQLDGAAKIMVISWSVISKIINSRIIITCYYYYYRRDFWCLGTFSACVSYVSPETQPDRRCLWQKFNQLVFVVKWIVLCFCGTEFLSSCGLTLLHSGEWRIWKRQCSTSLLRIHPNVDYAVSPN